jgi:hypothetical protein
MSLRIKFDASDYDHEYKETCDEKFFYLLYINGAIPRYIPIYITHSNTGWMTLEETKKYHKEIVNKFNLEINVSI